MREHKAAGRPVKALDNQPKLDDVQHVLYSCCTDLGAEASWRDVRDWCEHYDLPLDFVWPVYRSASSALLERIYRKADAKPTKPNR